MPYHTLIAATCAACHGSRRVGSAACSACEGTGLILPPLRSAVAVLILCGMTVALVAWLMP